jgi:hypothetical protein
MKRTILCIEGASASSRRENQTISSVVRPIVEKQPDYGTANLSYHEIDSTFGTYGLMKDYIFKDINDPGNHNLIVIGKSLGAAKSYCFFKKFKKKLAKFNKLRLSLVDPHGRPLVYGSGFLTYGSRWGRDLEPLRIDADFISYNCYQRNKYPMGASFPTGCSNIQLNMTPEGKPVDHWNIIYQQQVKYNIELALQF